MCSHFPVVQSSHRGICVVSCWSDRDSVRDVGKNAALPTLRRVNISSNFLKKNPYSSCSAVILPLLKLFGER